MTTTEKKLTITMSERRPVKIVKAEWPVIATAFRHDGAVECQANHEWMISVREHADGRRLVYGWLQAGNGGVVRGWSGTAGGFLVAPAGDKPDDDETVRSIRRVGGIIDDDKLADECIGNLPAEDVDGKPIMMPREEAMRLLRTIDATVDEAGSFIDPRYAQSIRQIADELRAVLSK